MYKINLYVTNIISEKLNNILNNNNRMNYSCIHFETCL